MDKANKNNLPSALYEIAGTALSSVALSVVQRVAQNNATLLVEWYRTAIVASPELASAPAEDVARRFVGILLPDFLPQHVSRLVGSIVEILATRAKRGAN